MKVSSRAVGALLAAAVSAGAAAAADAPRTFTLTTKSEAAREQFREMQKMVESFQGGPPTARGPRTCRPCALSPRSARSRWRSAFPPVGRRADVG